MFPHPENAGAAMMAAMSLPIMETSAKALAADLAVVRGSFGFELADEVRDATMEPFGASMSGELVRKSCLAQEARRGHYEANISTHDVYVDSLLTAISVGYSNPDYIKNLIAPVVPVPRPTGFVPTYMQSDWFRSQAYQAHKRWTSLEGCCTKSWHLTRAIDRFLQLPVLSRAVPISAPITNWTVSLSNLLFPYVFPPNVPLMVWRI